MPRKVKEPAISYDAGPAIISGSLVGKLFPNGRSQAVRLPKEFRMPGSEVLIRREGRSLVLTPIAPPDLDEAAWQADLASAMLPAQADPDSWTVSDLMRSEREDR